MGRVVDITEPSACQRHGSFARRRDANKRSLLRMAMAALLFKELELRSTKQRPRAQEGAGEDKGYDGYEPVRDMLTHWNQLTWLPKLRAPSCCRGPACNEPFKCSKKTQTWVQQQCCVPCTATTGQSSDVGRPERCSLEMGARGGGSCSVVADPEQQLS